MSRPPIEGTCMETLFAVEPEIRGALISECGRYRYRLWRYWDLDAPIMVWVMLNPSTADATVDDPTIRKCMGFARRNGHGGVIVVNLFAWRATDPNELSRVNDPVGPENDEHIRWACQAPVLATVVAGWGVENVAHRRARVVLTLVRSTGRLVKCFGRSKDGHPRHPLYLPYSSSCIDL